MSSFTVTYRGINDDSQSSDSRIAFSPPYNPAKFGTYAGYLLVASFIIFSFFLM